MFQTPHQAKSVALKLTDAQLSLQVAQQLTAFVIGIGNWQTTLDRLARGDATYPSDWTVTAALRYSLVRTRNRSRFPDFDEVFMPAPFPVGTSLAGLETSDQIRRLTRNALPYCPMYAELGLGADEKPSAWLKSERVLADGLCFTTTLEVSSDPDQPSPITVWEWNASTRDEHGTVLCAMRGQAFTALPSCAAMTPKEVERVMRDASRWDSEPVEAFYASGRALGPAGLMIVADAHVPPAARGRDLAATTLRHAVQALRRFRPDIATLAIDLQHLSNGLPLPHDAPVTPEALLQSLRTRQWPRLIDRLAPTGIQIVELPCFVRSRGRNLTLRLIASTAGTEAPYGTVTGHSEREAEQLRADLLRTHPKDFAASAQPNAFRNAQKDRRKKKRKQHNVPTRAQPSAHHASGSST